jgi:hypothetical protein
MLRLALFMTYTTMSFGKMMRFPTGRLSNEQNYMLCSESACDASDNIPCVELVRKQIALTRHRIILYDSRRETVIREFQNENYSFKTWINHLRDKELITSSRDILLVSPIKYCCNIASTMHDFQNKVLNTTTTATSIFPGIVKREKKSEK